MTTYPNIGLTLPVRGVSGAGVWDDTQDANTALIDAHDHSPGKGTTVKTNGIEINADLTFASLYAPINLHRLTFASIVALTSNNKSLFVNAVNNELTWRSSAGTNVQITNGAALNVGAFAGAIGGDYVSVAAALNFDDSGDRYTFKQNSGTGWARLASGDVRLFETGTSDAVFVGLAAPSALAVSYTMTFPTSPDPGSTGFARVLTVSPSGTVSTTPFAAAGQVFPIQLAAPASGATLGSTLALLTTTGSNYLPVIMPTGGTVTAWKVWIQKTSAAGTISAQLELINGANGSVSNIGAAATNSANNPGYVQLEITGLSNANGDGFFFRINLTGGGTTGDIVLGYRVVWT